MSAPRKPATPAAKAPGLSRRRLLGGALAGAVAAVVLGRQAPSKPLPMPDRWKGKTRWIGHC